MCGRCLWSLPAPVLTPGEFLVGEVSTDPSTFPQQKQLLRIGCVPVTRPVLTLTLFRPEVPGDTWSLRCFLCLHAQPLPYWPDPCLCAIPSWSLLSSFSLSQQPQLVSGSVVGAFQAAGWKRARTILGCPCSSSGLLDLPLLLPAAVSPPYPNLGGGEEGKDVSNAFE